MADSPRPPFTPPSKACVDFDVADTPERNLAASADATRAINLLDAVADHNQPAGVQTAAKSIRDAIIEGNLTGLAGQFDSLRKNEQSVPAQSVINELNSEFTKAHAKTGIAMQQDGSITIFERNEDIESLRYGANGKFAVTSTSDKNGKTQIGTQDITADEAMMQVDYGNRTHGKSGIAPTAGEMNKQIGLQLDANRYIMRHAMLAPNGCDVSTAAEMEKWLMMHDMTPEQFYSKNQKK
jgi:hypothetical protein